MEQSAGCVLFTQRGAQRLYVIVTEHDGHTGLPKGHIEPGETRQQTALREVMEEVGVQATLIGDACLEETYALPRGGEKNVAYFLASFEGPVCPDPTQVCQAQLLPLREAITALTFEGARRILLEADQILSAMK